MYPASLTHSYVCPSTLPHTHYPSSEVIGGKIEAVAPGINVSKWCDSDLSYQGKSVCSCSLLHCHQNMLPSNDLTGGRIEAVAPEFSVLKRCNINLSVEKNEVVQYYIQTKA